MIDAARPGRNETGTKRGRESFPGDDRPHGKTIPGNDSRPLVRNATRIHLPVLDVNGVGSRFRATLGHMERRSPETTPDPSRETRHEFICRS
jgi:hypothetical protein